MATAMLENGAVNQEMLGAPAKLTSRQVYTRVSIAKLNNATTAPHRWPRWSGGVARHRNTMRTGNAPRRAERVSGSETPREAVRYRP